MEYIKDERLTNFPFWSGAADRAKSLEYSELEELDEKVADYFAGDTLPTESQINDLFWFDFKEVCHMLGYACDDADDPVRDVDDFKEDYRLEVLKDYADAAGWTYTDEQLKELDAKCIEEGDAYELKAEEDTFDIVDGVIDGYAQEVGITEA